MEAWLESLMAGLLAALALPQVGLVSVFLIALVSATLLPLGSEPAVFLLVKSDPALFWPAVLVATEAGRVDNVCLACTAMVPLLLCLWLLA